MKKFFVNFALVLAMVAGVGLAFANGAKPVVHTLKAQINGSWVTLSPSQEYSCQYQPNEICTAEFDENDEMIPETVEEGRFVAE
jgi:hypothetical protein